MNEERIKNFTLAFDDFLLNQIEKEQISYDEIAAITCARLVAISQLTGHEETILRLLPVMEQSIIARQADDLLQ
jgi:hypothetical protein